MNIKLVNKKLGISLIIMCLLQNIEAYLNPFSGLCKHRDKITGICASLLSEVPFYIPSYFFTYNSESVLFKISEIKAKRVFWNAYTTVPAYKDFIDRQCSSIPTSLVQLPLMSKDSYIKQYPLLKTLKHEKLPQEGYMDPSSGTSGRRTLWIRGQEEIACAQKMMNLVRTLFLEKDNYVLINMFLPSAWSLGLMRGLGPNVQEAYETLKDLGTQPKYLIMGHTSLMKYFVQHAPIDLSKFDITFLLGGEHLSRSLHRYFLQQGIKKVIVGYGASDIHFTVGIQEDFAQTLQELCWNNPALKKDLTGTEQGLPYFFQYSPLQDYIEEVDGHLVFTDLDHTRVSPRVRYDIGDRGKIIRMSFVQEVLKKHEIDLKPYIQLPLICLYGRIEHAIFFNGVELAFDDLELALENTQLGKYVNRYAYNQYMDNDGIKRLELWVELQEHISLDQFDSIQCQQEVLQALCKINSLFSKTLVQDMCNTPSLKIYAYGTSPLLSESYLRKEKFLYNHAPSMQEASDIIACASSVED